MRLLIAHVSPSSSENSPHMTKHALHQCQCPHPYRPNWSPRNSARLEGGRSMSRIQIDIWLQTGSIGSMSGLIAGQSMTSTSHWSRKPPCLVLHVTGHCLAQKQHSMRRPLSPTVACDPSKYGCCDASLLYYPGWPGCFSCHNGLHPRPWLMGCNFHELAECRNQSAFRLASGALEP